MKEIRRPGATHSFRLSIEASRIVDNIRHPRSQGGKSRKISDAIEWYFSPRGEEPSYDDLLRSIAVLQKKVLDYGNQLENVEKRPHTRGWGHRILAKIGLLDP